MQEKYTRIIFSAAVFLQILAAIWWASALNYSVEEQRTSLEEAVQLITVINTKVALLELRTSNLEDIAKEARDIVRRIEKEH